MKSKNLQYSRVPLASFFIGCHTLFFVFPTLLLPNDWAAEQLKNMTMREKIGQLLVVAAVSTPEPSSEILATQQLHSCYQMDQAHIEHLIKNYHVGGIIWLHKSTPQKQYELTNHYQSLSKTPLLIAQDCEWGLSMRLAADPTQVVGYPRNLMLGALSDKNLIYRVGKEIGNQCVALGVHMNLAPVVDVNNNHENPVIHDRSFGDNPTDVACKATLFMQGVRDAGVLSCAKHFPGHGDTNTDSHSALPIINHAISRLESIELVPFKELIENGIDAIMTAHIVVPCLDDNPASLSASIIQQELQHRLNFKGLVITDGLGMKAVSDRFHQPGQLELEAFLAGNDIILCPLAIPEAITLIEKAIENQCITLQELDRRVLKILHAKQQALTHQTDFKDFESIQQFIVRPEAYDLQKILYGLAITAVNDNYRSFSKELVARSCIIQVGSLPDNIFNTQAERYSSYVQQSTLASAEELEQCLQHVQLYNTVIVAIGSMNKFFNQNYGISDYTRHLYKKLKDQGKEVIIVLFGTPYSINYFNDADQILVAYEDAPAAQQAVIEVLIGNLTAEGILPISMDKNH